MKQHNQPTLLPEPKIMNSLNTKKEPLVRIIKAKKVTTAQKVGLGLTPIILLLVILIKVNFGTSVPRVNGAWTPTEAEIQQIMLHQEQ